MAKWLQQNSEPRERLRDYMSGTRVSRLAWIHGDAEPSYDDIIDIIKKYPRFADSDGHIWVE